jgi:hypothetical protein
MAGDRARSARRTVNHLRNVDALFAERFDNGCTVAYCKTDLNPGSTLSGNQQLSHKRTFNGGFWIL